ncbi:DsbA family protein [uncultured Photobacterium sp.]|uniref:DsbA family protein n=1 Tax=uncultured Photobacterium sp. TaxID=173973 RepID=UPI00262B778F|nr:DsbA family protein [uncultured Photobacterium sp.]
MMRIALVSVLLASLAGGAHAQETDDQEKFNAMLLTALKENPEILREGVLALQSLAKREKMEQQASLVARQSDALYRNSTDPVLNASGTVPMVEFFDYRCGACKAVANDIKTLATTDKRVKMIYKDVAILGPESEKLAKIAIAVNQLAPNSYPAFHSELMGMSGASEAGAYQLASLLGIDIKELKKTAASQAVKNKLDENNALFQALNLRGTPSIFVGDQLFPGVVSLNTLKGQVNIEEKDNKS